MTLRQTIIAGGLITALAVTLHQSRFDVRGPSIDDGNDSGGRVTRPLWDRPKPGDTVKFVRHSGLTDLVEVEKATIDVGHSGWLFAGIAVAFGLVARFTGRRPPEEKNL